MLKSLFTVLLAALSLGLPATSQGQSPRGIIDSFTEDIEIAVTSGQPSAQGPIQDLGKLELPLDPAMDIDRSADVAREVTLVINTPSIPATAAVSKSSPLVLLTAPVEGGERGAARLDLHYRGPEPGRSLGIPFTGTTGLRVSIRTLTQFKVNVQLFPVDGASARRWTFGDDIFPGTTTIEIPWTNFTQVDNANPRPPDSEAILQLSIAFTMTHPEDTPLIIESVELY